MEPTTRKRALSALLSAIVPGLGQALKQETVKAIVYLSAFATTLLLVWPIRLPNAWIGLVAVKIGAICLALIASLDALLAGAASRSRYLIVFPIVAALTLGDVPTGSIVLAEGLRVYYVPATDMEPSILKGDRVMADTRYYENRAPQRGDVVLLRHNGLSMKRVVGVEGDLIEGLGDQVWLNGQLLQETYIQHAGGPISNRLTFGPIRVPPRKLFLMDDNRDVSFDSRDPLFGPVSVRALLGKVLYVCVSRMPGRWGKKIE
jgi:signal peptidase I